MKVTEKLKHFIKGMGSVLNLFPEPPKIPVHEEGVCAEDWEIIGNDIKKVMLKTNRELLKDKKMKMHPTDISEEDLAKALGFQSVEELRKFTSAELKKSADGAINEK